jgi:ElaB/YqjD/DUF883 family membrane-anchored ribosome-binding protein
MSEVTTEVAKATSFISKAVAYVKAHAVGLAAAAGFVLGVIVRSIV